MSKPEPETAGKFVHDRHPLARHRAKHDNEKCAEKNIDTQLLTLRFVAANERRDKETGGQPCSRDPEDAELQVPRARNNVRKVLREWNAIKALALDAIVCGHHTHRDL